MEFKDYYAALDVPKAAAPKEIKHAFRKLARKYHPDVNPGDAAAERRFKGLNEAHEVLSDPDKRRKYDSLGANWRQHEQARAHGGPSPFEGGWTVNMGDTPGGGARTLSQEEMEELLSGGSPFSDFFTTFFGGAAAQPKRRPARRRGRDLETAIELTLEEAFHGVTRRVRIQHEDQPRTVDVRIPAGIEDAARVRVTGGGERREQAGDLYLRVRVAPHTQFERRGRDLYVPLVVPAFRAVLGGQVDVPTIGGKTVRLKLPELTRHGQTFRIKGYGMPAVGKPDAQGDAFARVNVQVPSRLTPAEREHYEALERLATSDEPNSDS